MRSHDFLLRLWGRRPPGVEGLQSDPAKLKLHRLKKEKPSGDPDQDRYASCHDGPDLPSLPHPTPDSTDTQ